MIKVQIKKEVEITNEEIAKIISRDGRVIDGIRQILDDWLYDEYKMDYSERCDALSDLTTIDYIEILRLLSNEITKLDRY